jgi:nucleoside-diphosphate-sugar epimerase
MSSTTPDTNTSDLAVVIGAGPVGTTVALQLAEAGRRVRLVTRSGSGPEHALIERRRADASNAAALAEVFAGATAVFDCMHGSKYDAKTWRAELFVAEAAVLDEAGKVGAVVVFPESLYAFGPGVRPMREDSPLVATTGKLGIRAELLRARAASSTPTVSVMASDFYGPYALMAHAGERMVPFVLDGKTVRPVGNTDAEHSWTYVPDLAAAMIKAADTPSLHNTILMAPTAAPMSSRALVGLMAKTAGVTAPKVSGIPAGLLKTLGLVMPSMREYAEAAYQFTSPFVMDSSHSEQLLGLAPTPMADGVAATIAWWRAR